MFPNWFWSSQFYICLWASILKHLGQWFSSLNPCKNHVYSLLKHNSGPHPTSSLDPGEAKNLHFYQVLGDIIAVGPRATLWEALVLVR